VWGWDRCNASVWTRDPTILGGPRGRSSRTLSRAVFAAILEERRTTTMTTTCTILNTSGVAVVIETLVLSQVVEVNNL
jgi:hypothetical protein